MEKDSPRRGAGVRNSEIRMLYQVRVGQRSYRIELQNSEEPPATPGASTGRWRIRLGGRELLIDAAQAGANTLSLLMNGQSFELRRERLQDSLRILIRGTAYSVSIEDPRSLRSRKRAGMDDAGPQKLVSSMPGKVVRVLAREGDAVAAGQGVVVVEAMKMQNEVRSPKAGTLVRMLAKPGKNVDAGEVLAIVE
jgi:biotin carboxyl carrier protein